MTGDLGETDLSRMARRRGRCRCRPSRAWRCSTPALAPGEPVLVPAAAGPGRGGAGARPGRCPPLLRGLVRGRCGGPAAAARRRPVNGLAARLAGLSAAERPRLRCSTWSAAQAAAVLGHAGPDGGRARPGVQGARLRLADRGRAAQPARRGRPGCGCPRRWSSTTRPRPRWPSTCCAELLGEQARRRGGARRRRAAADEPIAIVGMGCRFPGGADARRSCGSCWPAGGDAIGGVPGRPGLGPGGAVRPGPGRAGQDLRARGRVPARRGGVRRGVLRDLARVRRWRWIRSSGCCWRRAWEALERAGIDPPSLRGSATGVFAGRDRPRLRRRGWTPPEVDGLPGDRRRGERGLGPGGVHAGAGGPGGDGGHGVLVVAGGVAPGRARRCGPGSARWRWPAG